MQRGRIDRRSFLRQGVAAGTAGWALSRASASSYARVIGANDRINLGLIGCGGRGRYILQHMTPLEVAGRHLGEAGPGQQESNLELVGVCDVWKNRLETYPTEAEKLFGHKPKPYAAYRELLESPDIDAVIIATPDHQHAGQTIDAVQSGKHAYVEKPIIGLDCDLPELNRLYDVVKASKVVIQHGTHGVSGPAARALKEFIAGGKLGKLFRVEGTETAYRPYWVGYGGPQTEDQTDWKAWLYNRKPRPFDAHMHAKWMGYWEITSGTIGGWMTHFINMVHYVTGCEAPISAVAWGGKYAPTEDPRCTAPDNTMVMLDYAEGFHTQFTSHFGSEIDNERIVFMFEKGSIRCKFGHWLVNPIVSSEGTPGDMKPKGLLETDEPYPGADHVRNWLDCIRTGNRPNADMEFGYKQGITVVMGDMACRLGRKVTFDKKAREVKV
ncbi:MAG: dehydrogenase [Phycisphaerae bacterium]